MPDPTSEVTLSPDDRKFELTHHQNASIAIWTDYFTFFTWFVAGSVAILGWLATQEVKTNAANLICLVMMGASAFGVIASIGLLIYEFAARKRAVTLAKEQPAKDISRLLGNLTKTSAALMSLVLIGLAAIWIYVFLHQGDFLRLKV